tara:strand:- start:1057 stop:1344 length:288 start_codon:yes stop_codon:yes gene_type:complete
MYILSLHGQEGEGAYAVTNDDGYKALYLFEQKDDATRYAGLLEANEAIPLTVVEIDDKLAVDTCQKHKYKYVIISADDIVIPPKDYDNIQDNTVA